MRFTYNLFQRIIYIKWPHIKVIPSTGEALLRHFLVIKIVCLTTFAHAQDIIYGTNQYIEYHVGTLPLLISVSHGGSLEPFTIPDRTCNDPVYALDVFTIETALEIKNALFEATGCYPHLIISNLKRTKLDPNRNLTEAACGNEEAEIAWNEFHDFIEDARNTTNLQYNGNTFFVDLHGHGNPISRIELGYLLYDDELELSDSILNTNEYITYSSIQNLVFDNLNNFTHAELLRGEKAFGTLLSNQTFPTVPSQSILSPGTDANYYSGGYITANHTCYSPGVNINGVQMELNYEGIRNSPSSRANFATAFSQVIIEYLNTHFDMIWNICDPVLSINEKDSTNNIFIYPNPTLPEESISFDNLKNTIYDYYIFNALGQITKSGQLSQNHNKITLHALKMGIYLVKVIDVQGAEENMIKFIVH